MLQHTSVVVVVAVTTTSSLAKKKTVTAALHCYYYDTHYALLHSRVFLDFFFVIAGKGRSSHIPLAYRT